MIETIEHSDKVITASKEKPLRSKSIIAEALSQEPIELIRELDRQSFYHFIKFFWPAVSNDKFSDNWHIKLVADELQKMAEQVGRMEPKLHDLIINIPPGTTKTIICSIMFPAWCWTQWAFMRFITASYSANLSLESADYCRDLIKSDLFRLIYPELAIKDDKDTKSNFRITRKDTMANGRTKLFVGGNRFSTSVGGTLTGFHGHFLIIDDPLDPKRAHSEKELENANHWMEQTLPTRKTDKAVTPMILVMQRLHQSDPSGRLLDKKKDKMKHLCLPGEIRNYHKQLTPSELKKHYIDDLLDPKRLSWTVMTELEADLGQYGFAGQIGQDPSPPGGGMFKIDMFNEVNTLPPGVTIVRSVRYWDKAGSDGTGAYTVGVKMSLLTNHRYLIENVVRGQWSAEKRERIIKNTALSDGHDCFVYVEQEPGSGGKESAEGTIRNLAGFVCYADKPTGDKIYRADPYSVIINNGDVWYMTGLWNFAFIEEHRFFPFGTYKDQVDAGAGAFNKLVRKKEARRIT